MGILKTEKARVEQLLIQLLAEDEEDVLREALTVAQRLYPGCELSLYDVNTKEIIGSTILNEEALASLKGVLSTIRKFTKTGRAAANVRDWVISMQTVLVSETDTSRIALVIEQKVESKVIPRDMETVHALLGTIAKLQCLERISKTAMHLDSLTGLKTRDSMLKELEHVKGDNVNICLLSLVNAESLNKKKGMCVTDRCLCDIALILAQECGKYVYRVGGTKFVVAKDCALYDMNAFMQDVIEKIADTSQENTMVLGAVITPLTDDLFNSLYICEKMVRTTQENEVIVVREKIPDVASDITHTFLPAHVNCYSKTDKEDMPQWDVEVEHFDKPPRKPKPDTTTSDSGANEPVGDDSNNTTEEFEFDFSFMDEE